MCFTLRFVYDLPHIANREECNINQIYAHFNIPATHIRSEYNRVESLIFMVFIIK